MEDFYSLNKKIIECRLCPRLALHRETVPARACFAKETFWRRPLSGFGDEKGWLLILGLAPSAQGGNRTGRIFTGDLSGDFLFSALHKAGFANQPLGRSKDDGLKLIGCYITAIVKCVPPHNLPNPSEKKNCSRYLANELYLLKSLKAVLALGKIAYDGYCNFARSIDMAEEKMPFGHGALTTFKNMPSLYGSYHPSPQNTQTKKMTREMFLSLLDRIKKEAGR